MESDPSIRAVTGLWHRGLEADEVVAAVVGQERGERRIEPCGRVLDQRAARLRGKTAERLEPIRRFHRVIGGRRRRGRHIGAAVELERMHHCVGFGGRGCDILDVARDVVCVKPLGEEHDGLSSVDAAKTAKQIGRRVKEAPRVGIGQIHD